MRAQPRFAIRAEKRAHEMLQRALQVRKADALVHDQPLYLVKLRQMRGVGHVAAVDLAGRDHVDGRFFLLHDVHLRARGLGAQQHVGLAAHVGHVACTVEQVEGVLHRAAGVVFRGIEGGEVVPVGLDLAPAFYLVTQPGEDVGDLTDDVGDQMLAADGLGAARQGYVHGAGGHGSLQLGAAQLALARLERGLDGLAHLVDHASHGGALLFGHVAHAAQRRRERTLLAQHAYAQILEARRVGRGPNRGQRVVAQLCQIIRQCHAHPLFARRAGTSGATRVAAANSCREKPSSRFPMNKEI